jgi:hypothetical protein
MLPLETCPQPNFILDSGQHLFRIQVKSTAGVHDRGYIINACWASKGQIPYIRRTDRFPRSTRLLISDDAWLHLGIIPEGGETV